MATICALERLEDYAQYLQENPGEVKALSEEILIHITHFFRDAEAFQLLQERVFPSIMRSKSALAIRIWVAGCSTVRHIVELHGGTVKAQSLGDEPLKQLDFCPVN